MILYGTKVYVNNKDVGLTNIRQIRCTDNAYYAISYDDDLYVWGQSNLENKYIETPTLVLRNVKRMYFIMPWLAILNTNNILIMYKNYPKYEFITTNVKKFNFDTFGVLTLDGQYFKRGEVIPNIRYVSQNFMITNDNVYIDEYKRVENIKYARGDYLLSNDNILYKSNYRILNKLEDNVKYFSYSKYKDLIFVRTDNKRILYTPKRIEVNDDYLISDGVKLVIEGNQLAVNGRKLTF